MLTDNPDETVKNYLLVLDSSGNIASSDKEIKKLSLHEKEPSNLSDIFNQESSSKLLSLIQELHDTEKLSVTDKIEMHLNSGEKLFLIVSVNKIEDTSGLLYLCRFKEEPVTPQSGNLAELKFTVDPVIISGESEELRQILEIVRRDFPFSYIEKEKVRRMTDDLKFNFWIKDPDGKFLLINKIAAEKIGAKVTLVEGKNESEFIPGYLQEFMISVRKFISATQNTVILSGLPFLPGSSGSSREFVEIPVTDNENNLVAIVGFERLAKSEMRELKPFETVTMMPELPQGYAVLDNEGIIKHANKEFCKLFSFNFDDISGKHFSDVFAGNLSHYIQAFLNDENSTSLENSELLSSGSDAFKLVLLMHKNYSYARKLSGVTLLIKEDQNIDNLEKLIKVRGRMYDILIKNNPEPIFVYDKENLRFLDVNESALSLYGYRREDFLQMDLTDLYTPEDIQTLLDSSSENAVEGKFTGPFKHKKKDGDSVFVEICKISFTYENRPAHFNTIHNIDEKLELKKQNQLFRATFESSDDLIFITSNDGFITFSNRAVQDILFYSKEDLEKTSFAALVKDEERGIVTTTIFHSHLKDQVSIKLELKKQNGEYIESELTANPILDHNGEIESYLIIGKFIPPVPEPEQIIKEVEVIKEVIVEKPVPVQPEPETHEVAPTEDKAPDAGFLSNVFHEVLTPINVILGFVQELTESIETFTPEQKEAVDIINQNRVGLLNIMNSIMELTQIEEQSAELNLREVNITEIIDHLQKDIDEISSKGIQFAYGRISSSLSFHTDRARLQTLVSILLKFAAKISREKKIYFSAYPQDENNFAISLRDGYSSVSQIFLDHMNDILNNPGSTLIKHYGISKLSLRLSKALLRILGGEFVIFDKEGDKADYALIFPNDPSQVAEYQPEESEITDESTSPVVSDYESETIETTDTEIETVQEISAPEDLSDLTSEESLTEESSIEEYQPAEEDIQHEEVPESAVEPSEIPEEEQETVLQVEDTSSEVIDESVSLADTDEKIEMFNKASGFINLAALSCLYIEDQVDSQILFKVQMKELKSIKFAASFEEALPLLDTHHFDFIVMDINLQGEYNGLDALKIIHKMPGYEQIPIIAVTAYVLPGDKEKFIATGFSDFISKPIFREKMLEALDKIFHSMQ